MKEARSKIFEVAAHIILQGLRYTSVEVQKGPNTEPFAQAIYNDSDNLIPSDELFVARIVDGVVLYSAPLLRQNSSNDLSLEDAEKQVKRGFQDMPGFFPAVDMYKKNLLEEKTKRGEETR